VGHAADWPPTLDAKNPVIRCNDGRVVERYWHGPRAAWGYPASASSEWGYPPAEETGVAQQNHNSFYVVAPQRPRRNAPLVVILHSANRTAYDYLGFACLARKAAPADDPTTAMTNPPEDFYALFLNSTNAEWWGWTQAHANALNQIHAPPPAELRVLDTIEWVVSRYKIDRNRVYLSGVSMGGNGALGIGMPHGDIFAAMRVTVPAGTGYAAYGMGGFPSSTAAAEAQSGPDEGMNRASGSSLPDPPVIVDFSSPIDSWSRTQPALLQAAQAEHLPLILGWGAFGHTIFGSRIARYPQCQIALAYPWLQIRRNKAYPAFTHASTDQHSPWLGSPAEFDDSGQMNAYFRWSDKRDTSSKFVMQLWIAHPAVQNPPASMPDSAVVDITLRRLQQFKIRPGQIYAWRLSGGDGVVSSGEAHADAGDLLTIPQVKLSTTPENLSVYLDNERNMRQQ
jgi:poly(3-hydroxybutyrate) depolymerase